MIKNAIIFAIVFFFLMPLAPAAHAASLLEDIDRLASPSEYGDCELEESIADKIDRDPKNSSDLLLSAIASMDLTDIRLAIYIWALGLTKDIDAVDSIISIHNRSKSDLVQGHCLQALAAIGDKRSGNYLLSALDSAADKVERFYIINLLAQMQFEAVLPKAEEVLREDVKYFYWQSVFVFGKMGDKSVPLLLEKLNDEEFNVRANAIHVLGRWLIAPEAANRLQSQYWTEKDKEIRGLILSSLERTIVDFSILKSVFTQIAEKEKDPDLIKFAEETLNSMEQMQACIVSYKKGKQLSKTSFEREYSTMYRTAGKKGDYNILAISSSVDDEQKLKALKERILQRDSDEAFYDYQRVNDIIMCNRLVKYN